MLNCYRSRRTSIMHLLDDCSDLIFQCLECNSDRDSFGLTCKRWLSIQNSLRQSLQINRSYSDLSWAQICRLLNRFPHLKSLSLSGCFKLYGYSLRKLALYGSNLQALYLEFSELLTPFGMSSLASSCPRLSIVSFSSSNVTDTGLNILTKSCTRLKEVNLSYCEGISDVGIRYLVMNCRELESLRISYSYKVTGIGFEGCSETLTSLEAISCRLNTKGIRGIVSGGGIEYLNISCISRSVIGSGLTAIGSVLGSRLRVLDLRMCLTPVGDETVAVIAKGCRLLEEWNLVFCLEVGAPGWKSIGLNCMNLERLHVDCICDRGLRALRKGCKKLSVLYLGESEHWSGLALLKFKLVRPEVEVREEEVLSIAPSWAFSMRQKLNIK